MAATSTATPTIAVHATVERSDVLGTPDELASLLGLPLVDGPSDDYELLLVVTEERLELHQTDVQVSPVFCDFTSNDFRRRRAGSLRGELLAKAIGYKGERLTVVDATAGFGRDAILLALLGCSVTAVERNPVVAALLVDGVHRALGYPDLQEAVELLKLVTSDSREYLSALDQPPDVIYLDPMFVSKNRSARPKKELWALARLVRDDDDGASLLASALATGCRRVTVKRPDNGVPLEAPDGRAPDVQFPGKTVRFDVYLQPD
jgi:16S rRNA (guanine1516-N2)-methyltransferase